MNTISQETERVILAEQFAADYLLIMENDFNAYTDLMEKAKEAAGVAQLGDQLREDWESLTAQVVEITRAQLGAIAGDLISQMLEGQGSLPFDLIARRALEK